jgi:phosphatidylethanolamine/phosphatidyl-N-methylethanolamine N-methyltransferase
MSQASSSPSGPENTIASTKLLWKKLLQGPKTIGTVAPSSPWLARALVGVSALHDAKIIVEVGAGTGPLTGWIRESAPHARLLAVEPDDDLRTALQKAHPDVETSGALARDLPNALARRGLDGADRILSTVPWTLLPDHVMQRELDGIEAALRPGGRFVTLAYIHTHALPASKRLENSLRRRFATVTQSGVVWRNVPPGRWLVAESPRRLL